MLSGPGSGAMPMLIADRRICSIATCATSRGVGPASEFGGGVAPQMLISMPGLRVVAVVDRTIALVRPFPEGVSGRRLRVDDLT